MELYDMIIDLYHLRIAMEEFPSLLDVMASKYLPAVKETAELLGAIQKVCGPQANLQNVLKAAYETGYQDGTAGHTSKYKMKEDKQYERPNT